jgi:hypothetical protein
MPRRGTSFTQAAVARVLRAYRSEGVRVRTRLMPDGSTEFDPIEDVPDQRDGPSENDQGDVVL